MQGTEHFLDKYICEHTFKDEMLLRVQPMLKSPGGF